ncbi:MAG: TetR/AcrR family transcriptional regulator [Clostridia bacterium]|nr:TetR/AcrR family transcriptional regulator [Clostridia bacterium]
MSKLEEKKNMKRTNILDAAAKLFMDKSFASTAVDDVVKMAGVAKGTFYLYFKDKYDLLNQIVAYKGAEVLQGGIDSLLEKEQEQEMNLTEKVLFLVDFFADYLNSHRDLAALVNKNLTFFFKSFTSGENAEFAAVADRFISAFTSQGWTEAEAKMKVYMLTELIGTVCCEAVLETGPFTLEEIRPVLKNAAAGMLEVKRDD